MGKRLEEHHDENEKELSSIKAHLDKQDQAISSMQKTLNDVVTLLDGSVIGKTKGLVQVVDQISTSLEDMIGKFAHAEDWRVKFKAAQADNEVRNEKKRALSEQREFEAVQKDKEIEELKRGNKIKNWIAFGAIAFTVIKAIIDYYLK